MVSSADQIRHAPWESELFGCRAGNVVEVAEFDGDVGDYEFLVAKVDVGEEARVAALCALGFELIETALVLSQPRSGLTIPEPKLTVRHATDADCEAAVRIAGSRFTHSRFHRDGKIPKSLADESRAQWVHNGFHEGWGRLQVAVSDAGDVVGFILGKRKGAVSVLDLMAVDEAALGTGVGRALVAGYHSSIDEAETETLQVTTQATNVAATGLYLSQGYRYARASYSLHWHAPSKGC